MSFRCVFKEDTHEYFFHSSDKGRSRCWKVPSCSEVLSASGLVKGKAFMTDEHRHRGITVHRIIRDFYDGALTSPIEYGGFLRAFKRWASDVSFEPLQIEKVVYSRTWSYAGRLDLFGLVHNEFHLPDVKTGALPPTLPMQTASYSYALQEMNNAHYPNNRIARYGLRLFEDGHYKYERIKTSEALDFGEFRQHLQGVLQRPEYKRTVTA